jgi:hypothetical protein
MKVEVRLVFQKIQNTIKIVTPVLSSNLMKQRFFQTLKVYLTRLSQLFSLTLKLNDKIVLRSVNFLMTNKIRLQIHLLNM